MSLINYDSPDYQRLHQRAMSSPLARSNPAILRKLQSDYTKQRMQQHVAMEGAVQTKMRAEYDAKHNERMFGFSEREMGLKEADLGLSKKAQSERFRGNLINESYRTGKLDLERGHMKDNEDDLTMQTVMGLLPAAYSIYEGNRRSKQTDSLAAKQEAAYDAQIAASNRSNQPQLKLRNNKYALNEME